MPDRVAIHDVMSLYNHTYEQNYSTVHDSADMEDHDEHNIISHKQMILIMRVLMFGVTPAISIFGVVGNIFSIIILYKHGLHKCSNILLISLAVADLTYLVAFNSVPKILYQIVGIENGYGYNRDVSFVLFAFYQLTTTLDYGMGYITLVMPMLITFERLVAVYLPFKFNLIITPARTWCAVALTAMASFSIVVYMSFWMTFSYTFDANYNTSVGRLVRSRLYDNSPDSVTALQESIDYIFIKIPPVVTLAGCILIILKVWMASRQRRKMTQTNSKDTSSNRTTKMLLTVCALYMSACAIISSPFYLPSNLRDDLFASATSNLGPILYQIINIAVCINSSANFVIYVAMNKNFRDTYRSLFCRSTRN